MSASTADWEEAGPDEAYRPLLEDSAEDLYEAAPCGYLSTLADGTIVKVNETFLGWTGYGRDELLRGRRVQELLTVGGRVFHETHLAPLLRLQREVREIALDFVRTDGSRLSALVNAVVRSDPQSRSSVVRMTVFDASDRREYERELLRERRRAERNADRLRILQEMVVRCASVGEVDEIVAAVRDAGAQAFGATGATVWLPGPGDVAAPSPGDLAAPSPGDLAAPSPGDLAAPSPGTPEARAVAEQGVVLYEPARPGPGDARLRAVTPLLAEGRPLGTVSFGFAEARPLDGDELELMGTLGRQAGQALERARLQREAARRGRQATFLARTGRELDEVVGFDERAGRLVELVVAELGGDAAVEVLDPARPGWFAAGPAAGDGGRDGEPWPGRAAVGAALAEAVRAGRPAVLPAAQPVPAGEHRATVVLPLRARGRVLGALLLAGDGRRIGGRAGPDPVDDDFLMDLADRTGLALENARLYEEDREVARVLQRSMLAGAPPPDPRFQVVAAYQPGVATLEVGGDWHDAFAVAGDRVNLVVGDVVGRGLRAASAMGQLRSAVRALAGAGFGPAALLGHLDDYVATLEAGQMATVVLADLAVGSGELRYACAGHLPPLLLAPGEEPRYLWGGRSGPVGSFAAGGPRREHRIALARGSRLLLFTDGLIERRGEPLDRGMDRLLAEVAGRRGAPLPAMVDGVREAMAGGSGDDDLCLLAFAYEEAPTFRRELAADARLLSALRAALDGWLGQNGVPEPDRYGAVLACSEAVANAIEHGYRYDPAAVVSVTASISHGTLEIRVHDAGSWRRPGGSTDRGRGMTLMARTMDDLVVDRGEGTTVTLRRRLGRAAG